MGFGLGAVASAALGSIGTSLLQPAVSVWQTNKVNKANKEAAQTAYLHNVDLMNYQNWYNTPAEQMKRYEEAGLNPNLIYGQQNLSASAASAPVAHYERGNLDSVLGQISDRFLKGALKRREQSLAMRKLWLREEELNAASTKLAQDLELGQAQIQQVKTANLAAKMAALRTYLDARGLSYNLDLAIAKGIPLNAGEKERILSTLYTGARDFVEKATLKALKASDFMDKYGYFPLMGEEE